MTISLTTIIAGAAVVLLAILGSLINPFLRSLRFPKTEENEEDTPVSKEPITVIITAHDNLPELERNLPLFLKQQYAADYQVIVVCQAQMQKPRTISSACLQRILICIIHTFLRVPAI